MGVSSKRLRGLVMAALLALPLLLAACSSAGAHAPNPTDRDPIAATAEIEVEDDGETIRPVDRRREFVYVMRMGGID